MTKDFSIVGIGASAGGLNAVTEFFSQIPDDTGLAFVVIQHLSPDFKSLMDELLAKHTEMPIKVISGDTQVEENSIYLISSKSNIIIKDGIIKNVDRQATSVLNLPIDIFFHSLGEDLKEKSIGIILSGTGTDGSRGIRSIKEEGGLIFVQDPDDAQFDGMPNAAVATHLVDAVMRPGDIATRVASIAQKTDNGKKALLNVDEMTDLEIFKRILELVEKESNIDFLDYRQNTLVRRLEKRMYLSQTQNVNEYYNLLVKRRDEVRALFNEFLIGVTRFFRDKEAFEILNKIIIPNIFHEKEKHETLRIWCVGCSTGEEAYSTAILLTEHMENQGINKKFKIFATDVDRNAIKKAGQGVYPESIVSDVGNDFLERYFTKSSMGYKIKKSIRDNLVFTAHDALKDPPFINIDLLICRNMMIYLKPNVQKKLLSNFRFALSYESYLFLGPSESISSVKNAFKALNTRWNIFQLISREKPVAITRGRKIELPHHLQAEDRSGRQLGRGKDTVDYFQAYNRTDDFIAQAISQRYGPKSLFVDEKLNIVYINGDFKDILQFPKNFTDLSLLSRLKPEEHLLFRNGVRQALNAKESRIYQNVQFVRENSTIELDIQFSIFDNQELESPLTWIAFKTLEPEQDESSVEGRQVIGFNDYKNEKLNALEYELTQVKKEKQFLIEQLEAANEELQSSNEELLAANEELQSTNEELQSVNEELYTVNTELQSKINELITSNNDISNLLKSTNIGIIFLDKELRIRKFTPALKEQFDLEESDIGRSISNFTNSFSLNMNAEMKALFEGEQSLEREVEDQKGNTFLMRILPYWTSEREVDGAVISFIDLNELKEARRATDENADKYKAIFNHVNDVIITLDTEGTILSMNSDFGTGYEAGELIGTKFYDITDDGVDARLEAFQELLRTRKPVSYDFFYNSPQNEPKWFDVHLAPIIQKGEVSSAILIAHDVTLYKIKEGKLLDQSADLEKELFHRNQELEDANLELQEVNSYLDSFVHGAAHDLRAPLAQMKGMVRLLPKIKAKEQADMVLEQFKKGVEHMDNTLSGLIELIEFQKNTAEMISPVNLVEAYQRTREQLSTQVEEAQALINTDFQFTGEVYHIAAYIQSVFYNLLTNAIKYRREGEALQIDISIRKKESNYLIEIKDNGMGMDLTRYGHLLFKPFKRLTIDRSGMGIGLSIINSAIKKTGGRIEVESQLGKGTTFTVYLSDMDHENDRTPDDSTQT